MTTWCDAKTAVQVVEPGERVYLHGMRSTRRHLSRRSSLAGRNYGTLRSLFWSGPVNRKLQFAGVLARFVWHVLHLFFLIGFRKRLVVGYQWLVYFTAFKLDARLITSEEVVHSQ